MTSERDKASENPSDSDVEGEQPPQNPIDMMHGGPLERAYVTQHSGNVWRTLIVAIVCTAIVGILLYIRSLTGIYE